MLVKRNATLIHVFFVSSLEEVDQLWRWLTIDEIALSMLDCVQSWAPSFRGSRKILNSELRFFWPALYNDISCSVFRCLNVTHALFPLRYSYKVYHTRRWAHINVKLPYFHFVQVIPIINYHLMILHEIEMTQMSGDVLWSLEGRIASRPLDRRGWIWSL